MPGRRYKVGYFGEREEVGVGYGCCGNRTAILQDNCKTSEKKSQWMRTIITSYYVLSGLAAN
jgi:hypothetical protein